MSWAVFAGLMGAGSYKLVDIWLLRKPRQVDEMARQLREELRREVNEMRERCKALEAELSAERRESDRCKKNIYRILLDSAMPQEISAKVMDL